MYEDGLASNPYVAQLLIFVFWMFHKDVAVWLARKSISKGMLISSTDFFVLSGIGIEYAL